jgi:TP901 family phage tail tape measure protein
MAFTSGSPSAGQLEIGVALVLQDRFSNQAREASSVIRGLHRDAKNAVQANLTAVQSYANMASGVANSIVSTLTTTIQTGADFIDMMTSVGAISGATENQMSGLSETAQTLGLRTMFMSRDIASGMKYLAMAGNDANQIQQMISGAAMMANATGMELGGKGGTADLLTNIMRTFKLEGQQAVNIVGDQLTKATMSSNVSMTDLAESIKYSAASMVTLKQQLPQVAAMIGTLGNAGIQGSMAGTSIRNMADYLIQSLTNPNFKGAKALAKLGLGKQDFVDANGDLQDFAVILEKIGEATQGLSTIDQNAVFKSIFGVRGMRAAVAIMRDTEGYFDLLNKIQNNSAGFAEEVVGKRMETLAGKIDIVQSAAENLMTTFSEALGKNPIIMGFLDMVGWAISQLRDLMATPFGPWIAGFAAIAAVGLKVGSIWMGLRARWLLLNGDSQVSFKTMIRLMMGGWSQATMSAQGYLNMERAIIAQRKAGIGASAATVAGMARLPGYFYNGNIPAKMGANGRYYAQTGRGASGWTPVPAAMVTATDPGKMTRNLMNTTAAGAAANAASRGALASVGRGILGFGSKLLGFFGGPLGLAITGISIVGPMIYNALKSNKSSQDENTRATNDLASAIKASREGYKQRDNLQMMTVQELRWLVQTLGLYTDKISKLESKPVHVVINNDGKKAFEEYIGDRDAEMNVAAGVN